MRTGAPSEVAPRSAVSDSMPWASTTSTRCGDRRPGEPGALLAASVVACRPQPMATVTAAVGHAGRAQFLEQREQDRLARAGREASGMVTTTERAPRASSRRRGAPTGEAIAARMARREVRQPLPWPPAARTHRRGAR